MRGYYRMDPWMGVIWIIWDDGKSHPLLYKTSMCKFRILNHGFWMVFGFNTFGARDYSDARPPIFVWILECKHLPYNGHAGHHRSQTAALALLRFVQWFRPLRLFGILSKRSRDKRIASSTESCRVVGDFTFIGGCIPRLGILCDLIHWIRCLPALLKS